LVGNAAPKRALAQTRYRGRGIQADVAHRIPHGKVCVTKAYSLSPNAKRAKVAQLGVPNAVAGTGGRANSPCLNDIFVHLAHLPTKIPKTFVIKPSWHGPCS